MTNQSERAAAKWMDGLSDRIGSLIPGIGRLLARHPLKVSLVLGLFGYLAGATESILLAGSVLSNQPQTTDWVWLVRSLILASFVVFPFAIWSGYSWWRIVLSTLTSFVLYCGVFYLSENIGIAKVRSYPAVNAPDSTVNLLYTFAIGAGFILAISVVETRRSRTAWIVRFFVACSVPLSLFIPEVLGKLTYTRIIVDLYYSLHLLHKISAFSMLVLQLALGPTGLALLLGASLWDTTRPPKFERIEPASPEVSGI